MTYLNPKLSRRSFLGSASASIAYTLAHTIASPLLPRPPLQVYGVLQGADVPKELENVLASPHLTVRALFLNVAGAFDKGRALRLMLARSGRNTPVHALRPGLDPRCLESAKHGLPVVLLGSFANGGGKAASKPTQDFNSSLMGLLRSSPWIYVEDPMLADQMKLMPRLSMVAPRIVGGLCSRVDPSVDFAFDHIRSGALGPIRQISTGLRVKDAMNLLEAKNIHRRLTALASEAGSPSLFQRGIAGLQPAISVCGSHGSLEIALYTSRERLEMLPVRLHHFASIAHGDLEFR